MGKKILKVIQETQTGKNIQFQDTRNNNIMTANELIRRLENGNSAYNKDYCVKHDKNGNKYVSSKPDGKENNNLG